MCVGVHNQFRKSGYKKRAMGNACSREERRGEKRRSFILLKDEFNV